MQPVPTPNSTASTARVKAMYEMGTWTPAGAAPTVPKSMAHFDFIANTLNNMTSNMGNDPLTAAARYGRMFVSEGFKIITPPDINNCYHDPYDQHEAASGDCEFLLKEWGMADPANTAQAAKDLATYNQSMHFSAGNGGATILPDPKALTDTTQVISSLVTDHASSWGVLFPIGMIMISVEFMLYMLVLIPVGQFILGILGWLIMMFESVLAQPLVSLSFLKTDGEGLMPQQVQTTMMVLFGVVIPPVLMTISLVIGLICFNAITEVLNHIFAPTVQGISAAGGALDQSYLSLGIYLIFYATLAYTLANSSFKMINLLPNFVMSWVGQRMESRAADASMVQQQAQG